MLKIIPDYNMVFVKQLEVDQQQTGDILLPSTIDREKKTQGEVLEVGLNLKEKYKKGDIVVYGRYAGEQIKLKEKGKEVEYVLLFDPNDSNSINKSDILGWIKEK